MQIETLLTLLLGGGAVTTIAAIFTGVQNLRNGSRSRERDTVAQIIQQRNEAFEDRDKAEASQAHAVEMRDYWRNRAGDLEFLLRQAGQPIPDLKTPPPPPRKSND